MSLALYHHNCILTVTIVSPWKLNHCILHGKIIKTQRQNGLSRVKPIWYRIAPYCITYHKRQGYKLVQLFQA